MENKIKKLIGNYKGKVITAELLKKELREMAVCTKTKLAARTYLGFLFNEYNIEDLKNVRRKENSLILILNEEGNVLVFEDEIIAFRDEINDSIPDSAKNLKIIDANGLTLTPGLIDQHIHGGFGVDFNEASFDEVFYLLEKLPAFGVTSILPTLVTADEEEIKRQINIINAVHSIKSEDTAKIQGVHLEGPFISPDYKGIHPKESIRKPSVSNYKKIEHPLIRLVTLAPELDRDFELIKYLTENSVTAFAGHSGADYQTVTDAAKAGLKGITHIFNALTPYHHRKPGIIGAGLTNNDLFVEVIADGLHINSVTVDLIIRTKPSEKIIFISDSLPINRSNMPSMMFAGQEIMANDNIAINSDGTIAGSTIFLDTALKNLTKWNLGNIKSFIEYASQNPSQNLKEINTGCIKKGNKADIVIWDKDFNVHTTLIDGKIVFEKDKNS